MSERYFSIFCRQAEQHLATLRSGLLALDRHPTRSSLLHELLAVAHALKGSALMVGVADVAAIADKLEEHFQGMVNGSSAVDAAGILLLARGVDAVCLITAALAAGEEPGLDVGRFVEEYAREQVAPPSRQEHDRTASGRSYPTAAGGAATLDALEHLIGEMRGKKNGAENGPSPVVAHAGSGEACPETVLRRFWRELEDDVLYLDYRIRELREKTEAEVASLQAALGLPGRA